jgi:hypothetical protein
MLELYHKPRLDVRPQLFKNEALLLVQPNVGLYEGYNWNQIYIETETKKRKIIKKELYT